MRELRPFQTAMLDQVRAYLAQGYRRICVVAPTGSGKSEVICRIIHGAVKLGKRVLVVVNRRALVLDMSERVDSWGIDHGIIMGDHARRKPWLSVHIASFDTLRRRRLPPADLVIVDECHFSVTDGWLDLLGRWPAAAIIGMTATPIRTDGRGLGRFYQQMVTGPSVEDLTAQGYLVPARVIRGQHEPDMSKVEVDRRTGDYNHKSASGAVNRTYLIGDVVEHWLNRGRGMPTACFALDINHSLKIRDAFRAAGVRCEHADADTPDGVRAQLWRDLQDYKVEIVTSVGIISYGWNAPRVACLIDAAPTASLQRHVQKLGRGLRTAEGKTECLVLDHARNTLAHGLVEDTHEWTLDDRFRQKGKGATDAPGVYTCKQCRRVYPISRDACPDCGTARTKIAREIVELASSMSEEIVPVYYRCQQCGRGGKLPDGLSLDTPCAHCGVNALTSLDQPEQVLSPAEVAERRAWYFRAVDDALAAGFGIERANVQHVARWGVPAPHKWRKEAARAAVNDFATLAEGVPCS